MVGGRIFGIGAEIAQPLELNGLARGRVAQAGLELAAGENLERIGVQVGFESSLLLGVFWIGLGEEMVVEPHFGVQGVGSRYPVNGSPYLAAIGRLATAGLRIVRAMDFGDLAIVIFDDIDALDEEAPSQADFPPWSEAEILLGWILVEITALDIEFAREGDLASAGLRILRIIDRVQLLAFPLPGS